MVRIGIAGIGFMGMIHYLAAAKLRGAKVTAVCSRDRKKLAGDWRGIRGNFGPAGTEMDLGKVKRCASFRDLLADPDIDLVDICTPTVLHEEMAVAALKAGKHVLVEKAIAMDTKGADTMLRAAAKAGRRLTCTSTTRTSSAWSPGCLSAFSLPALSLRTAVCST